MGQPVPHIHRPDHQGWDIEFTRMSRPVLAHVHQCARELTLRFQTLGLSCETQVRPTPRGLSTFLTVVGQGRLLFIVDFTLVDGMAVAGHAGAALDVRLLDASGDVREHCCPAPSPGGPGYHASFDRTFASAVSGLSATGLYLMAIDNFDLLSGR